MTQMTGPKKGKMLLKLSEKTRVWGKVQNKGTCTCRVAKPVKRYSVREKITDKRKDKGDWGVGGKRSHLSTTQQTKKVRKKKKDEEEKKKERRGKGEQP